jgi:hypothetical protein
MRSALTVVFFIFSVLVTETSEYMLYIGRDEKGRVRAIVSAGAYTATLYFVVNVVKRGWACTPRPHPQQPELIFPS